MIVQRAGSYAAAAATGLGWRRGSACLFVALLVCVASSVAAGVAHGAEPAATLPTGDKYQGPRIERFIPRLMPENELGDDRCNEVIGLLEEGWQLVDRDIPPENGYSTHRLEGDVVIGHPPHGDFYFNHDTEDANFFVTPDFHEPLASDPNADYRALLGFGNFGTGEPKEHGRIEVEGEYGALPWNDAADKGYYGLPPFVWANTGDRLLGLRLRARQTLRLAHRDPPAMVRRDAAKHGGAPNRARREPARLGGSARVRRP